jgi:hypothetical protein
MRRAIRAFGDGMPLVSSRRALGAILSVVAVATAGVSYASADSAAPHGHVREIHLAESSATPALTFVDTGKPGLTPGDLVVTSDDLTRDGRPGAGVLQQSCTIVRPASSPFTSSSECSGSLALEEGTITLEGPFVAALPAQKAAITGGTGAFAAARGEVVVRAEDDAITVRLIR